MHAWIEKVNVQIVNTLQNYCFEIVDNYMLVCYDEPQ